MFKLIRAKKNSIFTIAWISIISSMLSIYMNYVLQMSVDYIILRTTKLYVLIGNIIFMSLSIFFCDQVFEELLISLEKIHVTSLHRKRLLFKSPLQFRNRILMYSLGGRTNLDKNLNDMVELQADNFYTLIYYGLEILLFSIYLYIAVHWKILFLLMILIPVAFLSDRITRKVDGLNEEISTLNAKKDSIFLNSIKKIDWIHISNLEPVVEIVFKENLDMIFLTERKVLVFESTLLLLKEILNILITLIVPLFSGYLLLKNEIEPGGFLVSTNIYSRFLLPATMSILDMIKNKAENLSKMNEIEKNTDLCIQKKEYFFTFKQSDVLYAVDQGIYSHLDGTNIHFPMMKFKQNGIYLFKGSSGSGKTTMLHILCSCYDMKDWTPSFNSRFVTGDNISNMFAISTKNGCFCGDSLTEILNISSKEELINLLTMMNMPELFPIYDRESFDLLSGGERDLLFIIRAVLSNANIIFLDEPGAALDHKNRHKLYEFILRDSQKRTYVIASHDNYLDEQADIIYDVKNGKVEKRGQYGNNV